jgi:hypothetical protein
MVGMSLWGQVTWEDQMFSHLLWSFIDVIKLLEACRRYYQKMLLLSINYCGNTLFDPLMG